MSENESAAHPSMNIEKLYVKDISFESPLSPKAFGIDQSPEVGVQLGIGHAGLNAEQGLFEVTLSVTVTATSDGATVFLAEVKQAGIFRIGGVPHEQLPLVLEIGCPSVLLPFVREAINELVTRGGFPPLLISPINFEALFQEKLARAQAAQQSAATH